MMGGRNNEAESLGAWESQPAERSDNGSASESHYLLSRTFFLSTA